MRHIFSTLIVSWTIDLDPEGDGDLKSIQVKGSDLSEETLNAIKKDIKKLTTKVQAEEIDQPKE